MWKCTRCYAENNDDASSCQKCGAVRATNRFNANRPGGYAVSPGAAYAAQPVANGFAPQQGIQPSAYMPPQSSAFQGAPDVPQGGDAQGASGSRRARAQAAAMPPAESTNFRASQSAPRAENEPTAPAFRGVRYTPPAEPRFQPSVTAQTARKNTALSVWLSVCGWTLLILIPILTIIAYITSFSALQALLDQLILANSWPGFVVYIALGLIGLIAFILSTLIGSLILAAAHASKK